MVRLRRDYQGPLNDFKRPPQNIAHFINKPQIKNTHQFDKNCLILLTKHSQMTSKQSSTFTVQKFTLSSSELAKNATLKQSMQLLPGLYLNDTCPRDGRRSKVYLDFLFDYDADKGCSVDKLLGDWEEEARTIGEAVREKWGVDVAVLGSRRKEKEHACKVCGKVFAKSTALGGHTSKMHSSYSKQSAKGKKMQKKPASSKSKPISKSSPTASPTASPSKKDMDLTNLNVIVEESEQL